MLSDRDNIVDLDFLDVPVVRYPPGSAMVEVDGERIDLNDVPDAFEHPQASIDRLGITENEITAALEQKGVKST